MEEEGGFVLRKLIKEEGGGTPDAVQTADHSTPRSLDFPPGLVDIDNPTPAKGRWSELVKIVKNEQRNKKLSSVK